MTLELMIDTLVNVTNETINQVETCYLTLIHSLTHVRKGLRELPASIL